MTQSISDKELLLLIETKPVLTAKEVADFFDVTLSAANRRLAQLFLQGKLTRENINEPGKKGVTFGYKLPDGAIPAPIPKKLKGPTENGWHARYDAMVLRVQELEQWQRDAIARYPDLVVPEVVLRARRIAADNFKDKTTQQALLSGDMDDKPLMKAVIAALEAA